jgi:23S rRNA pseudouridine1911/1915/1917 synthase
MIMARELKRQYQAICLGEMIAGGTVDKPIGRHPTKRTLMAVVGNGRESRTHYRVLERFTGVSRLALELDTGRTHQIRVHMSDLGYPLIGDSVYSGRRRTPKGVTPEVRQAIESYGHQALHAVRLAFNHPITGEPLDFEVSLPDDMLSLLKLMRAK